MADQPTNKLKLSLDYRIIIIILMVVILSMLAIWRPWQQQTSGDRTITVTGEATISAEPDEYVFYPSYDFEGNDREAQLASLTAKSNEIVTKLKELGVADNKIKTNANNYDYRYFSSDPKETAQYSLQITVTTGSKEEATKVQNYLTTTNPSGQITPHVTFSDEKRKELQNQARDEATKDARTKADQSAANLGFNIGKVKAVEDGTGLYDVYPMMGGVAMDSTVAEPRSSSLDLQPGENDLNYSVKVTYFVD